MAGGFVLGNLVSLKAILDNDGISIAEKGRRADAAVQELSKQILEDTNWKDLEYTCSLIFNEENGLIYILKTIAAEKSFTGCKTRILDFLVKFLDYGQRHVQPYSPAIKAAGVSVFIRDSSAKNKSLAIELIIKALEYYKGSDARQDLEIDSLVDVLFKQLACTSTFPKTVKANVYHLLGVLCKEFPECIFGQSNKIKGLLFAELKKQIKAKSPEYAVIAGCFQGVTGYLNNFTFDDVGSELKDIFEFILKAIRNKDMQRYAMTIAALDLLAKHCQQFCTFIYERHKIMYDELSYWTKHHNRDLNKAGTAALNSFYEQLAETLLERQNDDGAKYVFEFYIKEFRKAMDAAFTSYQLKVAVRGYGSFAAPCKLFMSEDDVKYMLNDMILRSEQIYLNDTELLEDKMQNLPSFIEALSSITSNVDVVDRTMLRSLECLTVLLIENYPQVAMASQYFCPLAVIKMLFALHTKNAQFKSFLSRIVFQGLLRTCSHPVIVKRDPTDQTEYKKEKDPRNITYKDYLEFWKVLLNVVEIKAFATNSLSDRENVAEAIYDEIVLTIMEVCQKLDLKAEKTDDTQEMISCDPAEGLEPVNINDFKIVINLVSFSNDLLPEYHFGYFKKWIYRFGLEMISFCTKFPLVSSFYKMLEMCFKICRRINYFEENYKDDSQNVEMISTIAAEQKENCHRLFSKFVKEVIVRVHQYKDDLLASCLQMLLNLPKQLVRENLALLVTAMQMALQMGLSYLPIAETAITTLEMWQRYLRPEEIELHLSQIVPCLNDYLRSSVDLSIDVKDNLTIQTSSSKRGRRKIVLKNRAKKSEKGFDDIRLRILLVLGSLGSKAIIHMVATSPEQIANLAVSWDDKKHLKFAMPFADMKPVIYLDMFLPRVIDLANTATDRQIKVAACEFFHSLVLYMIGTGAIKSDSLLAKYPMDRLYKRVFPAVLRLSCDVEQVSKQLFETLSFQIIHWFTNSRKYETVETKVLLDAIIDCVVHPSDPRLRDFGARCVKEFVAWSIKQTTSKSQAKSAVNVTAVIKRLCSLSLHPNIFNRLGAALIFNNIYTVLREEESIVSTFIIELLYHFVTSLAIAHQDEQSFGTKTQCMAALDHIQRILRTKSFLINQHDNSRQIPKNFSGSDINSIVTWLIKQCGCAQTDCRRKCMRLAYELAPCIPNVSSSKNYFEKVLYQNESSFMVENFERGGLISKDGIALKDAKIPVSTDENFEMKATNWLELFLAPLDCYVWVFGEDLLDPAIIFQPQNNSCFVECVKLFLSHFSNESDSRPQSKATPKEIDIYEQTKCSVIVRLINLIVLLLKNYSSKIYTVFPCDVWDPEMFDLLARFVVEPKQLGFNLTDAEVVMNLPTEIENLLSALKANLPVDLLTKLERTVIKYLSTSESAVMLTESFKLNEETASLQMTHYVKVVGYLYSAGYQIKLGTFLNTTELAKHLFNVVRQSAVVHHGQKLLAVKMDPSVFDLANKMLLLALQLKIADVDVVLSLVDNTPVFSSTGQTIETRGNLFLNLFDMSFGSHLASCAISTFPIILERSSPNNLGEMFVTILDNVGKDRNIRKKYGAKVLSCMLELWPTICIKCIKQHNTWSERNSLLAILTKMLIIDSKVVCDESNPKFESLFSSYLKMFRNEDSKSLQIKSRLMDFLPFFMNLNETHTSELKNALMDLSQTFPLKSSELREGSPAHNEYMGIFNKILSALQLSGNLILLEFIISIVCRENEHICEEKIQMTLEKFIKTHPSNQQLPAIEVPFKVFCEEYSYPDDIRRASLERFCLTLLRYTNIVTLNKFFVAKIRQIMKILQSNEDKSNEEKLKIQLTSKIGCYQLIGLLYNIMDKDQVLGVGSEINKAFCDNDVSTGKELTQAIIKCANVTRKFQLSNDSVVMELRRQHNCAAYNTLIEVVCCTQTEAKFYSGFLFNENQAKGEIFLDNLVDITRKYQFDLELEKLFKRKKQFFRVRKEAREKIRAARAETGEIIDAEMSQSVHYLTSQYLCASSLSEEVSQFDFSLSHKAFIGKSSKPKQDTTIPTNELFEEIQLELDELNKHECMASMNSLLRHMQAVEILPNKASTDLPPSIKIFYEKLHGNSHSNIKLFIVKLILNNPKIFEPFAKKFLEPLMNVIITGVLGESLNYVINDLLIMILLWAPIAIPTDSIRERALANGVLTFGLRNAYHSRKDVFRNNLEIIKALVELWKERLDLPVPFIYENLNDKDVNSERNSAGIQVFGIFLVNGFSPTVHSADVPKEKFYKALAFNLGFKQSIVYAAAAEVIGMAMKHLAEKENETKGILHDEVSREMNELAQDVDRFIKALHKLQLHFPLFASRYVNKILFFLPKVHGQVKIMCLEIIENQIAGLDNPFIEMKNNDIDKLLTERNEAVQVIALRIVDKISRFCSSDNMLFLLMNVKVVFTQPSALCRKLAYDVCMWVYDNYKDEIDGHGESLKCEAREALLAGLADNDSGLRLLITNYWSHETRIPTATLQRTLAILNCLYSPSVEQHFLGYASYLLLEMTSRSPDFNRKIFEHPLSDCHFADYSVNYAWDARYSSMTPMFTQISSSQQSQMDSAEGQLRATQQLAFTPTQDQTGVYNWVTQSSVNTFALSGSLESSSSSSSMMFKITASPTKVQSDRPAASSNTEQTTGASQSLDTLRLRQRILKDKQATNRYFAKRQSVIQKMKEKTETVETEKKRNQVIMYRKYRIGDLPDIQINYCSVIAPLQALAEKDDIVAKMLFTSLVDGVLEEAVAQHDRSELNSVYTKLKTCLNHILRQSTKYFPAVMGFITEVAYHQNSHLTLDSDDLATACIASSQQNLGILLLETNIQHLDKKEPVEPKSKRMKMQTNTEDEELKPWFKLAELYKSLNNYDVVRGIFNKKFATQNLICQAIDYESIGDYTEAAKKYGIAITEHNTGQSGSSYNDEIDFWEESLLKCYDSLTNWEKMETYVVQSVTDDPMDDDLSAIWDDAYSQNHYLPYLIRSKLKRLLTNQGDGSLLKFIDEALSDKKNESRRVLLENKYSEELSLLYILQGQYSPALHYLNVSLNEFLNCWSSTSPLINLQRVAYAQDLLKLSEINKFLSVVKEPNRDKQTAFFRALLKRWKNYQIDSLDLLSVWNDIVCNRTFFISLIAKKSDGEIDNDVFVETKCQNWISYVKSAVKQKNFVVAFKGLEIIHKDKRKCPEFIQLYTKVHISNSKHKSQTDRVKSLTNAWDELAKKCDGSTLIKNSLQHKCENHRLHGELTEFLAAAFQEKLSLIDKLEPKYRKKLQRNVGKALNTETIVDDLLQLSFNHRQQVVNLAKSDEKMCADAHFDLAIFCDNRLRKIEEMSDDGTNLKESYSEIVVNSFLDAIKLGRAEAVEYFPRLLQISEWYPQTRKAFKSKTFATPCWMFLGWISQMLALLDKEEANIVQDILMEIAKLYPQALVYQFKLSSEGYKFNNMSNKYFVDKLESILSNVRHVEDFIFALEQLTDFDILFQDHKRKLEELIRKDGREIAETYRQMKTALFEIDERWGIYRTEFANQCKKQIAALDTEMNKINLTKFREHCLIISKEISSVKQRLARRSLLLTDYSPWLGQFNSLSCELEVPGQYVGGQKPLPENHVKIAGFDQNVLNLSSIRRPRQITIRGNNEKDYKFLVKHGEDLRLDQRIQQLLTLMNNIFKTDSECASRRLRLVTYQVIPLTTRLGLVEWIDDTLPLKTFIQSAMTTEEKQNYSNPSTGVTVQYLAWINAIKGGYTASYNNRKPLETITNFKKLAEQVPQNLLKRAFLNLSSSLEAFLVLRNHFVMSHSTICISHYFLGIGDRHLSNFMIDLNTGGMIGIDFGHAFGSATQFLPVPELMPFRLTPQLLSFMEPLREEGTFRACLIHAANALRNNSRQLINLMDVFIKEPSLDWKELAMKQASNQGVSDSEALESSWYPREKINFAQRKLNGDNPAYIMRDEVRLGHAKSAAASSLEKICLGENPQKIRSRCQTTGLTVQQQVTCLLDQATDENILGRTYHGWEPWI